MTESTKIDYVSIVQDLRDEADLCRNETATDIADLLDDAASCIVAMKSQFTALRSELAAAQEARQRAEVLAEEYRKDAERYRWLRDAPQDKIIVEAPDGEGNTFYAWGANLDAAIDAARKP